MKTFDMDLATKQIIANQSVWNALCNLRYIRRMERQEKRVRTEEAKPIAVLESITVYPDLVDGAKH